MPTYEEVLELIYNCNFKCDTYNGGKGNYVIGPNGNNIFLPLAGYYTDELEGEGYQCAFWSGSYCIENSYTAWCLDCFEGSAEWYNNYRARGRSVRPVKDRPKE